MKVTVKAQFSSCPARAPFHFPSPPPGPSRRGKNRETKVKIPLAKLAWATVFFSIFDNSRENKAKPLRLYKSYNYCLFARPAHVAESSPLARLQDLLSKTVKVRCLSWHVKSYNPVSARSTNSRGKKS